MEMRNVETREESMMEYALKKVNKNLYPTLWSLTGKI
jgi:hypothetical protein